MESASGRVLYVMFTLFSCTWEHDSVLALLIDITLMSIWYGLFRLILLAHIPEAAPRNMH